MQADRNIKMQVGSDFNMQADRNIKMQVGSDIKMQVGIISTMLSLSIPSIIL